MKGWSGLRRVNVLRWVLVAVFSSVMAAGALFTGLSVPEKGLAVAFFGGLAVYAAVRVLRVRAGRGAWTPSWHDGPYRGRHVRGVAYPVRPAPTGLVTVALVLMGVALLGGALYIGVTGEGVEGGAVTRVVAVVLLVLFGFILAAGGAAMSAAGRRADHRKVVLAADALHLPIPYTGGPIPWDAVTSAGEGPRGRAYNVEAPRFALKIIGAEGPLAQVAVDEMPDSAPLAEAITAVAGDPSLRAALDTPDVLPRFQRALGATPRSSPGFRR